MGKNPGDRSELQLRTEKNGDEIIIHAAGRITLATSELLQSHIGPLIPGAKRIVLDIAEIDYIDSSGLGALVRVYLAASKAPCDLEMANPQQRIRDLFKMTRLASVFAGPRKNISA